jgi:high frequency lysogenization protein
MRTDTDRAIALAGVFQAAFLAQQIAREGRVDEAAFENSLNSILQTDPEDVAAVYGGPSGVRLGLATLVRQLDRPGGRDLEITRHTVTLLQLAPRLNADPSRMANLAEGIDNTRAKLEEFPLSHENQVSALADLYQRNVSTLGPRVMVRGEPLHLQDPGNQARIRAALLAGVRAAILWQQCGGSRWTLLFGRRRLTSAAQTLLAST